MVQPKLRFKHEDGTAFPEWEEIKLENAVDFLDEKRKPITSKYRNKGQYPYYGASGIIDYIDNYIFDEELVLLSEDGANIVDRNYRVSFIATGKYWVNNHAHCLRTKKGFSSYFISESLENIDYTVYNTGSAQPKLNQEVCRNLPLVCPCFEEQKKITDFLSTVDEVIVQSESEVQNLEQQKKAAMQKIFSQEVRFRRKDGTTFPEWEEIKLENAVDFLDEKRKPITSKYRNKGQYPYYGASGIIDYVDDYIFDEELVLLSEDGANIVDRNYRVSFIATGKYWVNNHAHCLRTKEGFSSYFISEALENIDYTVYNTGSAQPKLNQEVCRNLPLVCPCLEEQQKIADFLSAYDEAVIYAKQELGKWKELKKGLSQQMFA